eukprot:Polyplicarium_translucidae@DN3395_c1_g1_i13.p1
MRTTVTGVVGVVGVVGCGTVWHALKWAGARGGTDTTRTGDGPAPSMCGGDLRWRDLGAAFQNEYLGGGVDRVAPMLWSCVESRATCYGLGDRFRGIETMYHVALLAGKPFFISLAGSNFLQMLTPRDFYWNVTDVPALEDGSLAGTVPLQNATVIYNTRNVLQRRKTGPRLRPESNRVWNRKVAIRQHWHKLLVLQQLVPIARRKWRGNMPLSIAEVSESLQRMNGGHRFGCVWHTLFRVAPELQDRVAESIFEVAQKSQLLPQTATIDEVLDRSGLRSFFESRYGNLSMPRATMNEAMAAMFPNTVNTDAMPTYVSVHFRAGTGLSWEERKVRVPMHLVNETVGCALHYGGSNDVRIIFASDAVRAKEGAMATSDRVITLSITAVPGHTDYSEDVESEMFRSLTEMIVISLSDKFIGCRSGFGRTAASIGFFPEVLRASEELVTREGPCRYFDRVRPVELAVSARSMTALMRRRRARARP